MKAGEGKAQPQLRAGGRLGSTEGCLPNSEPTRKKAGRNQDAAKLLTQHPSKSAIWAGLSTANQEPRRLNGAAPKLEVEGRATAAHLRKAAPEVPASNRICQPAENHEPRRLN